MNDDIKAIEAATQVYLDGLYEGDVAKLASVFHPTSALTQSQGGELKIVPREQWFEAVRNRKSPQETGLERGDRVVQDNLNCVKRGYKDMQEIPAAVIAGK